MPLVPDAKVSQRLDVLKVKIHDLQTTETQLLDTLSKVHEQQREAKAEYAHLSNPSAPIFALPNEVMVEIFSQLQGGWRNGLPALVQATHIMRKWRTLALSIPTLWSTIELRPADVTLRYNTDIVREYLARSGSTSLLDVFIFMGPGQDPHPALNMLLPHIGRWQRLVIESADEPALHAFTKALRDLAAPCLEYLQIDLEIDDEQDQDLWDGDNRTLGRGVPLLSYLGLRGVNMQCYLPPLQGVKSLYMADCYSANLLSYARFREILLASTTLTHLELEGMINCSPDDDLTLIKMPSLVSLSVLPPDYVNPLEYMRNIFTAISAPALRTLCLRKVYGLQFRTFLDTFREAAWHPVLQTLRLESVTGLEHLSPTFALSSPTITHLSLKFTDAKPILQLLMSNRDDPLWPCLDTLTLGAEHDGLLRSVITQRISAGYPLGKIRIATESHSSFEKLPSERINWLKERVKVDNISFYDM